MKKKVGEEVIFKIETEFKLLQKSIARATKQVIGVIDTEQWLTEDIENLKRFVLRFNFEPTVRGFPRKLLF